MLHENDRGIGGEVLKRVYGKLYDRGESASQGHEEYSDGTDCEQRGFRRKIYYVNDTACEIMGYTREEYIRKMQDGWADLMDVDLREVIREHNEQIRSRTPFEVLSRPQTKNGGYKWILSRVNVQMQEGPLCYVSFMDVTDRMEREELCRQENEVLRAGDAGLLYEASKPRRAGEACLRGASGERRR